MLTMDDAAERDTHSESLRDVMQCNGNHKEYDASERCSGTLGFFEWEA